MRMNCFIITVLTVGMTDKCQTCALITFFYQFVWLF